MGRRTIKVVKYSDIEIEKSANAALYPGYLLELMSTDKVRAHATAGGNATPVMFALENELEGKGIDDAYAADDKVKVWVAGRGDIACAILADGQNASIGSPLESNGDGKLKVHVTDADSWESAEPGAIAVYPNQIVGIAVEAENLSDSSGAESSAVYGPIGQRIKVRIV